MPAVMDTPDAQAEKAFRAWPLRIVGIERGGKLIFDDRFMPAKGGIDVRQLDEWLKNNLDEQPGHVSG